ncbi:MAG: acetyl-CoA carboxylase biotin carboxyl carrier protein [Planctomycetota bacterium]
MDIERLERIVELMNANDLVEVEIETEETKIRLKKAGANAPAAFPAYAPMPAAFPGAAPAGPGAAMPAAGAAEEAVKVEGQTVTFNSPMVGTFYEAGSPGADPFVRVGTKVGASSVLCIIEAMKVMNEITADMEGEIVEVLVGNGEAVEYGQPLFTIRPR